MQKINAGGSSGTLGGVGSIALKSLDSFIKYCKEYCHYEFINYFAFVDQFKDKDVAEMGCGHGLMSICISEIVKTLDGYDVDNGAIKYATYLANIFGLSNRVKFFSFSGYETSAMSKSYDIVLSMDVIEHVPNPTKYLNECCRILRDDGKLILTTPNGLTTKKNDCLIKIRSPWHLTEYYPDELRVVVERAGFEIVEYYSRYNPNKIVFSPNFSLRLFYYIYCHSSNRLQKFIYLIRSKIKLLMRNRNVDQEVDRVNITTLDKITAENCDVILIIARKKNENALSKDSDQ